MSVCRLRPRPSTRGITHHFSVQLIRWASSRGFTILETLTVLAVVGIITGIVLGGMEILRKSSMFSGSSGDLITSLRKTRAEAFGRGIYTAFIIDTVGGRWWGIEAPNGINLSTFNPSAPGTVIVSGTLPTEMVFGPSGGYGAALPAPFAGIPTLPGQSPNFNYCSFCNTSSPNTGFGEILFEPAGSAQFSGGPASVGQQFTMQGAFQGRTRTTAVAITTFSAVVEKFER